MCFSTLFIKEPQNWATITNALKSLTRSGVSDIRYIGDVEDLTDDKSVVDVVVMQLTGQADYALEIYWKGMMTLADDAVGMYLANALGSAVIVSDDSLSPYSWLRLSPSGIIENIDLDIEQLDEHSIVRYKIA